MIFFKIKSANTKCLCHNFCDFVKSLKIYVLVGLKTLPTLHVSIPSSPSTVEYKNI